MNQNKIMKMERNKRIHKWFFVSNLNMYDSSFDLQRSHRPIDLMMYFILVWFWLLAHLHKFFIKYPCEHIVGGYDINVA